MNIHSVLETVIDVKTRVQHIHNVATSNHYISNDAMAKNYSLVFSKSNSFINAIMKTLEWKGKPDHGKFTGASRIRVKRESSLEQINESLIAQKENIDTLITFLGKRKNKIVDNKTNKFHTLEVKVLNYINAISEAIEKITQEEISKTLATDKK